MGLLISASPSPSNKPNPASLKQKTTENVEGEVGKMTPQGEKPKTKRRSRNQSGPQMTINRNNSRCVQAKHGRPLSQTKTSKLASNGELETTPPRCALVGSSPATASKIASIKPATSRPTKSQQINWQASKPSSTEPEMGADYSSRDLAVPGHHESHPTSSNPRNQWSNAC